MIRVILIVEQPLLREGIRASLERMGDCVIVGESTNAAEVFEIVCTENPDVALIDAELGFFDPHEMARQMRHLEPLIGIILLASFEDEEGLFQAMKAGAAAYYSRNISPEALVEAVREVSHSEDLIIDAVLSNTQLVRRVLKYYWERTADDDSATKPLSSREVEILNYISRGMNNKEIALALKIGDQTVKNHVTSIMKKFSVADRTAAVVQALRRGWIHLN